MDPKLVSVVWEVIKKCNKCNKNKVLKYKPYSLLQSILLANKAQGLVSQDLIVKLPKSQEPVTNTKYNSILVIVDQLTKYAYFVPYKESHIAEDFAYTFIRIIISNHGLPNKVITDRGTTFASKFQQALIKQLGTKHKLTLAYHPQINGQTKRTNQTLEQYLQNYINYYQNDWVTWLLLAQLAYNSATSSTIGIIPFFANYRFKLDIVKENREITNNLVVVITIGELTKLYKELKQEISFVNI